MRADQVMILDRLVEDGVLERREVIELGANHVYVVEDCTDEPGHAWQRGREVDLCPGCSISVVDSRTGQEVGPTHAVYTARVSLEKS